MTLITKAVSRFECRDFQRIQAEARAQIALHHFYGFTGGKTTMERLCEGLERRKLIVRRQYGRPS